VLKLTHLLPIGISTQTFFKVTGFAEATELGLWCRGTGFA